MKHSCYRETGMCREESCTPGKPVGDGARGKEQGSFLLTTALLFSFMPAWLGFATLALREQFRGSCSGFSDASQASQGHSPLHQSRNRSNVSILAILTVRSIQGYKCGEVLAGGPVGEKIGFEDVVVIDGEADGRGGTRFRRLGFTDEWHKLNASGVQ